MSIFSQITFFLRVPLTAFWHSNYNKHFFRRLIFGVWVTYFKQNARQGQDICFYFYQPTNNIVRCCRRKCFIFFFQIHLLSILDNIIHQNVAAWKTNAEKKFQILINQYLWDFALFLNLTINDVVDRCSNTVKAEMLNSDLQSSRQPQTVWRAISMVDYKNLEVNLYVKIFFLWQIGTWIHSDKCLN